MLNLASCLEASARDLPDKLAIVDGRRRLTFAQVNEEANRIAQGLTKLGVTRGDRVALSCLNTSEFPILYYGILKTGAAVVPLNVLLKPREIHYHLEDSQAKAYLCGAGSDALPLSRSAEEAMALKPATEHLFTSDGSGSQNLCHLVDGATGDFASSSTDPNDTCVLLYTSGTTGQPKGAELSHANMMMNAMIGKDLFASEPDDVQLVILPLFHSFGQTCQLNAGFIAGHTLVLRPRFEARDAIQAMLDEGVSIFCGVPTMYWAVLNEIKDDADAQSVRKLRIGVSGGASMPVEIMSQFEERFDLPILEGYGLSETSPVATFNRIGRPRKKGSVGIPIWGTEARIVDETRKPLAPMEKGEVALRGHHIMKGYFGREEATQTVIEGGWFYTGDIGHIDEDGYLYITDRVKDMINRGGMNVYPREIEEILLTHPEVSLVAVVSFPDDRLGEEVMAYVVRDRESTLNEEQLIQWAKVQMADYKYPRRIQFRTELPMTATGKILKRELRASQS